MWMFTNIGFFSVVSDYNDSTRVMVRSRCQADLERLLSGWGDSWGSPPDIIDNVGTDYSHRAFVDRDYWAVLAYGLVTDIEYPNFKNECHRAFPDEHKRHSMLMRIWTAAKNWQDSMHAFPSRGKVPADPPMPDNVRDFWMTQYDYDLPEDEY